MVSVLKKDIDLIKMYNGESLNDYVDLKTCHTVIDYHIFIYQVLNYVDCTWT